MSKNGELSWNIIQRRDLVIGNSLNVCEGVITRQRNKNGTIEKSVIDYILFNNKIKDFVTKIVIDDKRRQKREFGIR